MSPDGTRIVTDWRVWDAKTFAVLGELEGDTAVVGEFVAGTNGLGYLIQAAIGSMQTTVAFASIVILSLMGIVLFAIVEAFERVFVSCNH